MPTQAELLFALAAEHPPTAVASEGARAVLRGRRFFRCNNGPRCSVGVSGTEFPLTPEQLDQGDSPTMPCPECGRILGATEIVPIPANLCWLCGEAVRDIRSQAISLNPLSGVMALAHEHCATEAGGEKLTAMATSRAQLRFPACRNCGADYAEHGAILGNAWSAYCDVDEHGEYIWYRPAEPFRERGFPHRLIIDSPRYAENIFAETYDEAVDRLRTMARATRGYAA